MTGVQTCALPICFTLPVGFKNNTSAGTPINGQYGYQLFVSLSVYKWGDSTDCGTNLSYATQPMSVQFSATAPGYTVQWTTTNQIDYVCDQLSGDGSFYCPY